MLRCDFLNIEMYYKIVERIELFWGNCIKYVILFLEKKGIG